MNILPSKLSIAVKTEEKVIEEWLTEFVIIVIAVSKIITDYSAGLLAKNLKMNVTNYKIIFHYF